MPKLGRYRVQAVALVAVGLLVAYFFSTRDTRPNPDAAVRATLVAIDTQDWGHLYDNAPPEEFAKNGIKREAFINFMQGLARRVPDKAKLKAVSSSRRIDVQGETVLTVEFRSMKGNKVTSEMRFYYTREGWKTALNSLPVSLARLASPSPQFWEVIAAELDNAKIDKLVMIDTGHFATPANLRLAAKGEMSDHLLWKPL